MKARTAVRRGQEDPRPELLLREGERREKFEKNK